MICHIDSVGRMISVVLCAFYGSFDPAFFLPLVCPSQEVTYEKAYPKRMPNVICDEIRLSGVY